jgi:hypothetical protein
MTGHALSEPPDGADDLIAVVPQGHVRDGGRLGRELLRVQRARGYERGNRAPSPCPGRSRATT